MKISLGEFLERFIAEGGDVSQVGYTLPIGNGSLAYRRITNFSLQGLEMQDSHGQCWGSSKNFLRRGRSIRLLPLPKFPRRDHQTFTTLELGLAVTL